MAELLLDKTETLPLHIVSRRNFVVPLPPLPKKKKERKTIKQLFTRKSI